MKKPNLAALWLMLLTFPILNWAQVEVQNRVRTYYGNLHDAIELTGNRQVKTELLRHILIFKKVDELFL